MGKCFSFLSHPEPLLCCQVLCDQGVLTMALSSRLEKGTVPSMQTTVLWKGYIERYIFTSSAGFSVWYFFFAYLCFSVLFHFPTVNIYKFPN